MSKLALARDVNPAAAATGVVLARVGIHNAGLIVMGLARRLAAIAFLVFALSHVTLPSAQAVEPGEVLSNSALEARARAISAGLRCLVCQNQSIDDSSAPLARDLRLLVRERLVAGDTDKAVRAYVVDRYGEFVLLSPPFNLGTLLLWASPLLLLAAGLGLAARQLAGAKRASASGSQSEPPPLTEDEARRLDEILKSSRS